jgi:membrane-associated phospholipid phosphatase
VPAAESSGPRGASPAPRSIFRTVSAGLVLMAVGLIAIGAVVTHLSRLDRLRAWDASISEELANSRSHRFESIAEFVSRLADTFSIVASVAVISVVVASARKWRAMAFVPIGLLIEIACFGAVNYAVQRPRPDVVKVGPVPSTFSFPSGHVAATVVCWIGAALLLAMFGRSRLASLVAGVGVLMVALVGWARVYLGMHYALDTLLGAAMGGGALAIAARALWSRVFDGASDDRSVPPSAVDDVVQRRTVEEAAQVVGTMNRASVLSDVRQVWLDERFRDADETLASLRALDELDPLGVFENRAAPNHLVCRAFAR